MNGDVTTFETRLNESNLNKDNEKPLTRRLYACVLFC